MKLKPSDMIGWEPPTLGKKAVRHLKVIHAKVDKAAEPFHKAASCRKGCSACCSRLPHVSLVEALALVNHSSWVNGKFFFKQIIIPKLIEQAKWISARFDEGMSVDQANHAYFDSGARCAFLKEDSDDCHEYPVRPIACRTHFVTSDPSNCSPPSGKAIEILDPTVLIDLALDRVLTLHQELDIPFAIGPLPNMALMAAIKLGIVDQKEIEDRISTEKDNGKKIR